MTAVLMSAEGPAEVINARRTESLDAPNILQLVSSNTQPQFGLVNVVNIIEKAVLAVTLNNEKEDVLAHAAFFDYPNIADVDQAEWEEWINLHFDYDKCTPLNTLFMHYFVAKAEFSHGSTREIIRTVFNAVPDIHFLFLIVPCGVTLEPALAEVFQAAEKKENSKPLENVSVFVCHRHKHGPVLFVRKARVEDHDDLTPIFNRQSDMLRTTYGDFFLAELIESQNENNCAIIVENEGSAVGFMSLSNDADLELLNNCFELGPFHGLHKPHDEDVLVPPTPPPPEEVAECEDDHGDSQTGDEKTPRSRSSSESSKKGDTMATPLSMPISGSGAGNKGTSATPPIVHTKPDGTGSVIDSSTEPRIQRKLSDAHMTSLTSVTSDHDDTESVRSATTKKSASVQSTPREVEATPLEPSHTPVLPPPLTKFTATYHGESNAFSIQLFCIDEIYEMRSLDFLPMAFSLFPHKEFCIVTVPHLVPVFPLLQSFVRITPKCPSILPQELYVFNRSGLLQSFHVRRACTNDVDAVERVIENIKNKDCLMEDLLLYTKAKRDLDGTPIKAYIATCLDQVIGVAITREERDIEYIRSHYNVEDFIYFNHHRRDEHGHLHHFALNPLFQHQTKHFLKEVLRQSHHTCLYYPVYPCHRSPETVDRHSLVTCLNYMVPVRARRQIIYPVDKLGGNNPSDRVLLQQDKYTLFHLNRKLTLEPKVNINARIVVVGASDTGIAFLETLVFCPHLQFNNLVLISPHGLPGELERDSTRSHFLSTSHCYSQDELSQVSLRSTVNVVSAKMLAISRIPAKNKLTNRKQKRPGKYVKVMGGYKVPYDHLVLCTGQQYQISAPTGANISKQVNNSQLPNNPNRHYTGRVPKNVFTVNDEHDVDRLLKWLESHFINTGGRIIVYGRSLDAYTAVQTLLSLRITSSQICLVLSPLNYDVTCFNNRDVEKAVHAALQSAGVELYSGYYLAQWNDGKGGEEVYCASFTSDTKPMKLECSGFLCFHKKAVDYDAFKAINDSCLVYDGSLVIDSMFHTNDLSIRGAGPLTKFQRRYHADQWTRSNFNSKEVGCSLAATILRLFDPTVENDTEPPPEPLNLIPSYQDAKVVGGLLPGGFHYLHFDKPSLPIPLEAQVSHSEYGRQLLTGSADGQSPNYFCVHINQYSNIETVTCLSSEPIDTSNLLCLYNIHERFLNNLASRFDEGLIPDFFSFFKETWCLAIFHDRFPDFRQEIRELLVQRPAQGVAALEEQVRELIDQDLELQIQDRKFLSDEFTNGGSKRAVETRLLSFLSYNYYHMPMYARPGMV